MRTLPAAFALALFALAWMPSIAPHPKLQGSLFGAAALVAAWNASLVLRGRTLAIDIALRKQHYLQACAQGTVLLYWGWYWREVYTALPLLVAQLAFAYAFDILLSWTRRDRYTLGFGPFPVVFSINLFLWFRAEWFYLQFLMIAAGFLAKEFIRWERDGRQRHIFNPSSFPLAVVSIALIVSGTTSWTWGADIARTQFNPPHIYLLLFLVGLPGQFLFGVTTMTMSAVVTTYLFGLGYFWATGSYFFIDSYIPIAVFLGMHLLFTDPSTSPATELGRIIFGVLYGLGNIVLYELLTRAGLPAFYDKLLPVPLLNLSVRFIDSLARSAWATPIDPAKLGRSLSPRLRNLAYIGVWSAIFVGMSAVQAVGDHHPGHRVPFWQQACQQNARNACSNLAVILDTYCADGSGWACNEVGMLRWHQRVSGGIERVDADFERGCGAGFARSCQNRLGLQLEAPPLQAPPQLRDYPVILREGKGALPDRTPEQVLTRACTEGWMIGCEDLGGLYLRGDAMTAKDPPRAAAAFERACDGKVAMSCSNAGYMYYNGDGIPADKEKGLQFLKRSCDLGYQKACQWMKEYQ